MKIQRIEIVFPVGITLPGGWEKTLVSLTDMVCDKYERENPTRVMWTAAMGAKPNWSAQDAAFLGKKPDPNAPQSGEPTYDDTVFCIECSEREDLHGNNPHNPNAQELQAKAQEARKAARQQLT